MMFDLKGTCILIDVKERTTRVTEYAGEGSLRRVYPQQEFVVISSGPLTGLPLLGANTWEVNCFNSEGKKTGGVFGTGSFGTVLRSAGYDRVVLCGTCPQPSYVLIDEEGARVREYDDFSDWHSFDRHVRGIAGSTPYSIFLAVEGRLVAGGLIGQREEINDFFRRHNVGAVVVLGKGRIPLAEPDRFLDKSLEISNRWRATGLGGGTAGCFACHGRCSGLVEETALPAEEQKELFIGLGICPQLVLQGAVLSTGDLIDLLAFSTGKRLSEEELWQQRQKGGPVHEC